MANRLALWNRRRGKVPQRRGCVGRSSGVGWPVCVGRRRSLRVAGPLSGRLRGLTYRIGQQRPNELHAGIDGLRKCGCGVAVCRRDHRPLGGFGRRRHAARSAPAARCVAWLPSWHGTVCRPAAIGPGSALRRWRSNAGRGPARSVPARNPRGPRFRPSTLRVSAMSRYPPCGGGWWWRSGADLHVKHSRAGNPRPQPQRSSAIDAGHAMPRSHWGDGGVGVAGRLADPHFHGMVVEHRVPRRGNDLRLAALPQGVEQHGRSCIDHVKPQTTIFRRAGAWLSGAVLGSRAPGPLDPEATGNRCPNDATGPIPRVRSGSRWRSWTGEDRFPKRRAVGSDTPAAWACTLAV